MAVDEGVAGIILSINIPKFFITIGHIRVPLEDTLRRPVRVVLHLVEGHGLKCIFAHLRKLLVVRPSKSLPR